MNRAFSHAYEDSATAAAAAADAEAVVCEQVEQEILETESFLVYTTDIMILIFTYYELIVAFHDAPKA